MLDVEHRDWMICLGRGFDFLHTPNIALIIGPYRPDLADLLRKAAGIIQNSMKTRRNPDDGFLLLASVLYDEISVVRTRTELKSHFLRASQPESYATNLAHWPEKCSNIPQCSTGVHADWN